MNTVHTTCDIKDTQRDFLVSEFGDNYIDIIEYEWMMSVEEFCGEYLEWNKEHICWVSLI